MSRGRLEHIDAAKGLSIFLVVYWHSVDNRLVINEALWMLRMPLFFFASGLFAKAVIDRPWVPFLRDKVGNILYLYVLWTFLVFGSTILIAQAFGPDPIDWTRPFRLFVEPPQTLWFMYALAVAFLLAKILQPLPWVPVFVGLFALYCWSISSGDWRIIPFYEKIIRLFPFFYLALNIKEPFLNFCEKWFRIGWLAFPAFIALALWVFLSPAHAWGPATFIAGLLGVTGVIMTARLFENSVAIRLLASIGLRSLLVYVMHRVPLFYLGHAMDVAGMEQNAISMSAVAVLVTVLCLIVGERIILPRIHWMFSAPWLGERDRLEARLAR